MELLDKLTILADAAKYDAACTSSGLDRAGRPARSSPLEVHAASYLAASARMVSLSSSSTLPPPLLFL